jgi:preprotein translocase subunit SecF
MMIRFNYKFAISGILSILYDTIIVLGCISFLNIEVCLITLTALLTIIGYCINDKIVVFDRIRDTLEMEDDKNAVDIVFISIKHVLTRSILTSMTTMLICSSLLFFGDRSIYELGLTINCGVFFGTISSLFFAPSLVLLFKISKKKKPLERDLMFFAS